MAKLMECREKLLGLVDELGRVQGSYELAKNLADKLDNGSEVDLADVRMQMTIGGTLIQLPVPVSQDQLSEHLADAANGAGQQIFDLWGKIYEVATEAASHCHSAMQSMQPPTQSAPPQQPPQPRLPPGHNFTPPNVGIAPPNPVAPVRVSMPTQQPIVTTPLQ